MTLTTRTPPVRVNPPTTPVRRSRFGRWTRADLRYSPYLYVAPFFIVFGIFGVYPMVRTFWMSLNDWDLVNERVEGHTFVGFDNYAALFKDDYFLNAVVNTVGMFFLATIPQLLLALFLASLLNRPALKSKLFFRMAVFVPNVTSVAAVAIVFGMLFQRDFGVINWFLHLFGLDAVDWHVGRLHSWIAISTMVDWRWTGYNTLIFLAGMQAISRDLYESAALDGASHWRQFWSITLPMLRPTFIFVTIVSIVGGMQLFTEPLLFHNGSILGGTVRESQTVTMYMWENSIENTNRAGYGAAVAWALFVIIMIASVLNFALIRKTVK